MLKAYFDRLEIVREKNFQYLPLKSNIWADILIRDSLEQGVPRRLALAPPALVVVEQAEPPSFVKSGTFRLPRRAESSDGNARRFTRASSRAAEGHQARRQRKDPALGIDPLPLNRRAVVGRVMSASPPKSRRIGPHSRAFRAGGTGAGIDGRSKEGRYLRRVIAELTAQLGREPTFAEGLLIRRAARASLILDLFDSKIMAGGAWTQVDSNTMGGVAGSLRLILRELGLKPVAPAKKVDLAEYLASKQAADDPTQKETPRQQALPARNRRDPATAARLLRLATVRDHLRPAATAATAG